MSRGISVQKRRHPHHAARARRHASVRRRISGTPERPRLSVYRSNRHIYAQVIDDARGHTLAAASTRDADVTDGKTVEAAADLGRKLGERAKSAGVTAVVFDRGSLKYHGRIQALADAAREAGLEF